MTVLAQRISVCGVGGRKDFSVNYTAIIIICMKKLKVDLSLTLPHTVPGGLQTGMVKAKL